MSKDRLFIFIALLPVCKSDANKFKPKFNLNVYRNYEPTMQNFRAYSLDGLPKRFGVPILLLPYISTSL